MTVDSLVASIILNLKEGGARVQLYGDVHCAARPFSDYSISKEEAKVAFHRAVDTHGWK